MPTKIQEGKPNTWNYRVLRHEDDGPDPVLGIHEVHYTEGMGIGPSAEPIIVGKDIDELLAVLELLRVATSKPVIDMRKSAEGEHTWKP